MNKLQNLNLIEEQEEFKVFVSDFELDSETEIKFPDGIEVLVNSVYLGKIDRLLIERDNRDLGRSFDLGRSATVYIYFCLSDIRKASVMFYGSGSSTIRKSNNFLFLDTGKNY